MEDNKKPQGKLKLHTSYAKRRKQHRITDRTRGWGKGVKDRAVFSLSLLYPGFIGVWLVMGLLWLIVTLLPYPVTLSLGRKLGLLIARVMPSRRYVVKRNLDLAFPELSGDEKARLEKEIYENAGMGMLETGMAWFWSDRRVLKHAFIDDEELKRAREMAERNERTLVLTCHFVSLELMARMYALLIKGGVGVYRPSDHPVFEYFQVKGRLKSNVALVDREDPRSIVKALMQGYPIWYAPDQDYGKKAAVFVPFFGVEKAASITATHDLARVKGVNVQPSWTIREKGGYRLYVSAPLENFPTENVEEDIKRVNQTLEKMIRMAPAQYLWMHRRFKTRPEGEPSRSPEIS